MSIYGLNKLILLTCKLNKFNWKYKNLIKLIFLNSLLTQFFFNLIQVILKDKLWQVFFRSWTNLVRFDIPTAHWAMMCSNSLDLGPLLFTFIGSNSYLVVYGIMALHFYINGMDSVDWCIMGQILNLISMA